MLNVDAKFWDDDDYMAVPAPYDANLLSQSDPRVQYDPMAGLKGGHACANCQWFKAGSNACQLVYGDIVPTGLSKLWLAQPEPYDPDQPLRVEVVNKEAKPADADKAAPKQLTIGGLKTFIRQAIKEIVSTVPGQEKPTSGFKVLPNHRWVAFHTNAYEDREKEIFPRHAHDDYIARVDSGQVPMPELWYWHMPVRSGVAEWVGRVDNIMMSVGKFDDTPTGKAFESHYEKEGNKYRVSHGYAYPSSLKVDGVYHAYDTFEISPLPIGKEANSFTSFERIKEMPVTAEKQKGLENILGPELAAKYLTSAEQRSKEIEAMGVKFKEIEPPASIAAIDADAREAIKAIATASQADAVGMKAIGDKLDAVLAALKEVKDAEKARDTRVGHIEEAVKAAFELQPSPRQAQSTVIPETNPLLTALKEKQFAGEKETSVLSLFMPQQPAKAE